MEKHLIKAQDVKDHCSIADLLSRLGFHPVRSSGRECTYLSMLRDTDTTPSLSVNDQIGVWYDHGLGKGGNIIDFGLLFWKELSFQEVLEKIVNTCDTGHPYPIPVKDYRRKRAPVKIPHYEILELKELGNNPAISRYLENRCVIDVSAGKLKEVYYYVEDQQKFRKHFFAAGWQNELGGWEVRNLYFKGCIGHKAISFIQGSDKRVAVFEGFFNYLSWLTENPTGIDSVIILNSLSLLNAGISKARGFGTISLYFDNDPSGKEAVLSFTKAFPAAIDCSGTYAGYNDYNEKLVDENSLYYITR
jgi:hypothetical protein